jgi:hypothetical protein
MTQPTASTPTGCVLLREIFIRAGGSHVDLASVDSTMAVERRAAVSIGPLRLHSSL